MSWRKRHSSRSYYGFAPYVPVATRKAQAANKLKKLEKKGSKLHPVMLQGKKIASTFWGKAWCKNLESYMDYSNRLPRGRSYVRNGSVLHLEIKPGEIEAKVAGSSLYTVKIQIQPVAPAQWKKLCKECAGQIGSLLELLSGKLSDSVMGVMTRQESGLFPSPKEIELNCSCPDWATMCKHVAAVLYGVGARLDHQPDLLFLLRSVDQSQLVSHAVEADITTGTGKPDSATLSDSDLADVFGIVIDTAAKKPVTKKSAAKKPAAKKPVARKPARKNVASKKPAAKKRVGKKVAPSKKKPSARKKAKGSTPSPVPEKKKRGRPKGAKDKKPRRPRGT